MNSAEFKEIVMKLKDIKSRGFIVSNRKHNTGIGKTLEDLLGIKENNIPGPDIGSTIELKSTRIGTSNMISLFTKSPLPRGVNSILRNTLGYTTPESKSQKILHTTLNASDFNTIRGGYGLKIGVNPDKIVIESNSINIAAYWDKFTLKNRFEHKLKQLLFVKALTKPFGDKESFHYTEAYLLSQFSFDDFVNLVIKGHIVADIRIGQQSNGKPHDHGTGFRVKEDKLDLCFKNRISLL